MSVTIDWGAAHGANTVPPVFAAPGTRIAILGDRGLWPLGDNPALWLLALPRVPGLTDRFDRRDLFVITDGDQPAMARLVPFDTGVDRHAGLRTVRDAVGEFDAAVVGLVQLSAPADRPTTLAHARLVAGPSDDLPLPAEITLFAFEADPSSPDLGWRMVQTAQFRTADCYADAAAALLDLPPHPAGTTALPCGRAEPDAPRRWRFSEGRPGLFD